MAVVKVINLNSIQKVDEPCVYAVQGDTNRSLRMNVMDMTLLSGMSGQLAMLREDNTYYSVACTIDISNNRFTADISQALTMAGLTRCQLKIQQGANVISSYTFIIKVEPSVVPALTEAEYLDVAQAVRIAVSQMDISAKLSSSDAITNETIDSLLV